MAFQFSLRPQTLTKLRRIRPLSSSTPPDSSVDTSSAAVPDPSSAVAAAAQLSPPSCASPSSDTKDRIFKKNNLDKPSFAASDDPKRTDHSFDFIRENLRRFTGVQPPKPSSRGLDYLTSRFTPPIKTDQLPSSIFGKEKPTDDADPKAPKTEKELREKLRRLLPEVKLRELEEKVADWIAELNDRLVKLRELEEKVADSIPSPIWGSIFGKEKPTDVADPKAPEWKETREKFRRLCPEVKLRQLEEKVADSIAELNYRLVRLRELEEKVADLIPSSIFGKEKPTHDADPKAPKWEKLLRERLWRLSPELRELEEKVADSIAELNDRLVKLRELEEKVADSDSITELNDRLEVKLCRLEEKVADSITELNDGLVKLRQLEENVADSIAKLNNRLVKLGKMEEKVVDSRMGSESLVGPPGNPLQGQGG